MGRDANVSPMAGESVADNNSAAGTLDGSLTQADVVRFWTTVLFLLAVSGLVLTNVIFVLRYSEKWLPGTSSRHLPPQLHRY